MTIPLPAPAEPRTEEVGSILGGSILGSIFERLAQADREDAAALLTGMQSHLDFERVRGAIDALNPEHFHLFLTHASDQLARALLDFQGQKNPRVQFLFTHYRFVEGHLKHLYSSFEGGACCADKSRWATKALLRYFANAQPIVLNIEQEYTFHLPKRVLNNQKVLLEFFEGLYSLYYGNPTQYLAALKNLSLAAAENAPLPDDNA